MLPSGRPAKMLRCCGAGCGGSEPACGFALPNALDARAAPAPPPADDDGSGSFIVFGIAARTLVARDVLGPPLADDDGPGSVAMLGRAF